MTLFELVEKYKGNATVAVSNATEGGKEFVVDFSTTEAAAIKDDIMGSEVLNFSATFGSRDAVPTIQVLVKPAADEKPAEEGTEETAPEAEQEP